MFHDEVVAYEELKRWMFTALPTPVRVQGRAYFRNCLMDLRDRLSGNREPQVPPHRLNVSGGGPFRLYGRTAVALCRRYAGLQADDAVLDIGCGIGRTALALTEFLLPSTPYLGFDVIRFAIDWCTRNISNQNRNFRFLHSDVHNWVYNPRGTLPPESYRFPAQPNEFQFALANSLFTHLGPDAAAHYVSETARVLAPGSRFFSSWFVLDGSAQSTATASSRFPHRVGEVGYASLHAPEQAVAFERRWIERTFEQHGFVVEQLHYGEWSGCPDHIESMQDVVIARKP